MVSTSNTTFSTSDTIPFFVGHDTCRICNVKKQRSKGFTLHFSHTEKPTAATVFKDQALVLF